MAWVVIHRRLRVENGLEREGLEVPSPLPLYPRQPGCCLATPGVQVMLRKVDGMG